MFGRVLVIYVSLALLSICCYANEVNHTIRVGFVLDSNDTREDTVERIEKALSLSNSLTYNPLGINLELSFSLKRETNIQYNVLTTAGVVSQAKQDITSDLDILNDTKTDIVFYIAPSLPNFSCGVAELPNHVEHFYNARTFIGIIKTGFCVNADVLSHEIGHMFGANHEEGNIGSHYKLKQYAVACRDGKNGSLMSYAPLRGSNFSSPSSCKIEGANNEKLVIDNAYLLASFYERSSTKDISSFDNTSNSSGGSFSFLNIVLGLIFLLRRKTSGYILGKS